MSAGTSWKSQKQSKERSCILFILSLSYLNPQRRIYSAFKMNRHHATCLACAPLFPLHDNVRIKNADNVFLRLADAFGISVGSSSM